MPHLECVNEEFQHYFIVDTPTRGKRPELAIEGAETGFCSKPKGKSGRNISLLIKRCKAFFYNLYV